MNSGLGAEGAVSAASRGGSGDHNLPVHPPGGTRIQSRRRHPGSSPLLRVAVDGLVDTTDGRPIRALDPTEALQERPVGYTGIGRMGLRAFMSEGE